MTEIAARSRRNLVLDRVNCLIDVAVAMRGLTSSLIAPHLEHPLVQRAD
jgi:hypothetical protein